ncbi:MAG: glycoside hydrolase family 3 C-terminal domain-containing protein [Bacteroidales bacterium]|nr:glycoside hydrolase family 3 C-terminal domain-containing protein [Bacteroidales bacterium]
MIRKNNYLLLPVLVVFFVSCNSHQGNQTSKPPKLPDEKQGTYWDYNLPEGKRADDLLSRMTLEEKVSQLTNHSQAIPRLEVPRYNWWGEALHGVARLSKATVFPQAIGLGATFDTSLIHRVATAISDEARAIYHQTLEKENYGRYRSLTFWSPNVNIFRDPRWGRGQETYGEDPFLSGLIGSSFVKGIQGDHPRYLKAGACAKHYVVHSGPEAMRHEFNALTSPKDLYETYLPAFKKLVDTDVLGVMCAYNETNGRPCCGSKPLLVDILRGDWDFDGYIVSDCWALRDIHENHHYTQTPVQSAAVAINNTVNLNCGDTYPYLLEAVKNKLVPEAKVDSALKTLLKIRFRLGHFDPPEMNPYASISPDVIHSEEHQQLAREAAQKSLVLLKNKDQTLPLKNDQHFIYVTGPNATDQQVLLGNYHGLSDNLVTILEGIVGKTLPGNTVRYRQGVLLDRENVNPLDWASGLASDADATIAVMGITPLLEGEEGESLASPHRGDRLQLGLPNHQVEYLRKLKQDNPNPVVVVLTGGSPIAAPEVQEIADAVLFAWYPGEQGGHAVADVLFGDANPTGKLPITFPASVNQLPPYDDYSMKGRTYKYMEQEPLYPFGFGLTYTQCEYTGLELSKKEITEGESLEATLTLTNKGNRVTEEAVQLYLSDVEASFRVPQYSLKGLQRVPLNPGETKQVHFTIDQQMMEVIDMAGNAVIEPGEYRITIGAASPGQRSLELGAPEPVVGTFNIKNE